MTAGDPNVVVRAVLAQPAYRRLRPSEGATESPLVRLLWWLGSLLHRFFAGMRAGKAATVGLEVVAVALFVAAVAALAFAVYGFVVRVGARAAPPGADRAGESTRRSSAYELRARAALAAERGEYAEAVALIFSAALAALDERAVIAYDGARTPGEYRRAVRGALAAAAAPFDELTARFVRASFAHETTVRADFDAAARAYAAFEPFAPRA